MARNARSASQKVARIKRLDLQDGGIAADEPSPELFFSMGEIADLTLDLIGVGAPRDENGRILEVRPKGHWFEHEVAKRLGYHYPPRAGLFPDLRHQALEIKHHTGKQITVDFGRNHPGDDRVIDEPWARAMRLRVCDIRYLIALAPPPQHVVSTIILCTGEQINEVFGVSPTQTIKYQMGIGKAWREAHLGCYVVGSKVYYRARTSD